MSRSWKHDRGDESDYPPPPSPSGEVDFTIHPVTVDLGEEPELILGASDETREAIGRAGMGRRGR